MMSMKGLSVLLFMVACNWNSVPGAGGALSGSSMDTSTSAVFMTVPSSVKVTPRSNFCALSSGAGSAFAALAPGLAAEGFGLANLAGSTGLPLASFCGMTSTTVPWKVQRLALIVSHTLSAISFKDGSC